MPQIHAEQQKKCFERQLQKWKRSGKRERIKKEKSSEKIKC